mmetsp:Transcript_35322/g.61123  ORF Transcript_35322/g.61123 Transcript_35322/m.61123 type:complete len:279 (-) Transcript_35322:96-932(-)
MRMKMMRAMANTLILFLVLTTAIVCEAFVLPKALPIQQLSSQQQKTRIKHDPFPASSIRASEVKQPRAEQKQDTTEKEKSSTDEKLFFKSLRLRLESAKAAALGGAVGGLSQLALAAALNPSLLLVARPASAAADLVALGGGAAEGALFGLLYRYVVRGDLTRPDPGLGFSVKQLGDGVVSSFALTSVLAHNQENLVKVAEVFVLSLPTAISDMTSVPEGGGALAAAGDVARALSSSPAAAAAAPPLLRDAAVAWLSFGLCRAALDRALLSGAIAQAD